jgi:hypothetical protein
MKYTKELTDQILHLYTVDQVSVPQIAETLSTQLAEDVPERSIIAKLSSLGVYKKKEYLTKRGEVPVKKEEYIERISKLLDVQSDFLESLEKVNKSVLALIARKLDNSDPKL